MFKQKLYETMDVRVRALMVSTGALKDSIMKGNTLNLGVNGSLINSVKSYSSQLGDDFRSLKNDYDSGGITLQQYISRLNVFISLLNAGIGDAEALHADEIRKEFFRVKSILESGDPDDREIQGITKSENNNHVKSMHDLVKARIHAAYHPQQTPLRQATVKDDPIQKSVVKEEPKISSKGLDAVLNLLEELSKKYK